MKLSAAMAAMVVMVWTAASTTAFAQVSMYAQPVAAPSDSGPHLTLDLAFPWDVTSLHGSTAYGLGGVGVAAGVRATPHWYVGGSAELEAVMRSGPATTDNPAGIAMIDRQRAGLELRYYRSGVGNPTFGSHGWIGLRYGVETVDNRVTLGRFADLTVATDSHIGSMSIGYYASVGMSFEQARSYDSSTDAGTTPAITADVTTASGSASADGAYIAFGMRLGFQ